MRGGGRLAAGEGRDKPRARAATRVAAEKKTSHQPIQSSHTLPRLLCPHSHLQDVLATTGVLLFSYPKANTSGCTTQALGHNEQAAAYKAKGFVVYGISADSKTTQANWRAKQNLGYPLLCDPSFTVLKQLGWVKDGGASVKRSHAVIAKGGKVLDLHTPVTPKDSIALGLEFIEGL